MIINSSGVREDVENDLILRIYQKLPTYDGWSEDGLGEEGLLDYEDPFGDNPEYSSAKLRHWQTQKGINSFEAIVRYHFEQARATRCLVDDVGFMTHDQEVNLNRASPE